ncbi:MAG: hypothetical protein ACTHNS_02335 [Marmoricola sp.]
MVTIHRRTHLRHTSGRGARLAVALMTSGAFVLSTGLVLLAQGGASAAAAPHKSYVCKYVGTPGVNEKLKTIIEVDDSAILKAGGAVKVGSTFSDKHGHSVVVAVHVGPRDPVPTLADCPAPVGPPAPGLATGSLTVTQATCTTPTASFTTSGTHVTFAPPSGSGIVPDPTTATTVSSQATADKGFAFADTSTVKQFDGTVQPFDPAACPGGGGGGGVGAPTTVTPAVHFTDAQCGVPGSWVGDDTAEIDYTPSGPVAAGPFTVTAAAKPGANVVIAPGAKTTFTFTYTAPSCGGGTTAPPQVVSTRAPAFTDATCAKPDATALDLPGTTVATAAGAVATSVLDGVTYTATGTVKPGQTVVIQATKGAAQVLASGSVTRWTHTFAKPTGCSTTSAPSDNGGQQGQQGQHGQHVVHHGTEAQQAAQQAVQQPAAVVPAFVDSGLVSTVSGQDAAAQGWLGQLRERALLLVLAGGLLLAGGGSWLGSCVALGRRRRGALV